MRNIQSHCTKPASSSSSGITVRVARGREARANVGVYPEDHVAHVKKKKTGWVTAVGGYSSARAPFRELPRRLTIHLKKCILLRI